VSLRARLLITLLVLTAAGLAAADLATFGALRSFLLDRVDQQLIVARQPAALALAHGQEPGFARGPGGLLFPPGTYAAFLDAGGAVVNAVTWSYEDPVADPGLDLPELLPGSGGEGARCSSRSRWTTCRAPCGVSWP